MIVAFDQLFAAQGQLVQLVQQVLLALALLLLVQQVLLLV
jgi:hypothetical protein